MKKIVSYEEIFPKNFLAKNFLAKNFLNKSSNTPSRGNF